MIGYNWSPASLVGCCGLGQNGLPSTPTKGQPIWCETRGGVYMCLPNTLEQAGIFKGLQRAVNDYYAKIGSTQRIRVDARIGASTVGAVRTIALAGHIAMGPPASTEETATNAVAYTRAIAAATGKPVDTSPAPKAGPGEIATTVPPDVESTRKQAGMPPIGKRHWGWYAVGGVLLAVVAVVGYRWYRDKRLEEEAGY